jgi:hypothetical protein
LRIEPDREGVEYNQNQMAQDILHDPGEQSQDNEKVDDAVRMIQGIAEGIDQEMMKKVAQCNYKTMSLTLRGHLV